MGCANLDTSNKLRGIQCVWCVHTVCVVYGSKPESVQATVRTNSSRLNLKLQLKKETLTFIQLFRLLCDVDINSVAKAPYVPSWGKKKRQSQAHRQICCQSLILLDCNNWIRYRIIRLDAVSQSNNSKSALQSSDWSQRGHARVLDS